MRRAGIGDGRAKSRGDFIDLYRSQDEAAAPISPHRVAHHTWETRPLHDSVSQANNVLWRCRGVKLAQASQAVCAWG